MNQLIVLFVLLFVTINIVTSQFTCECKLSNNDVHFLENVKENSCVEKCNELVEILNECNTKSTNSYTCRCDNKQVECSILLLERPLKNLVRERALTGSADSSDAGFSNAAAASNAQVSSGWTLGSTGITGSSSGTGTGSNNDGTSGSSISSSHSTTKHSTTKHSTTKHSTTKHSSTTTTTSGSGTASSASSASSGSSGNWSGQNLINKSSRMVCPCEATVQKAITHNQMI